MAIQSARIRVLNEAEPRTDARYVLYWMQQSQRARFNPALELAIEEANARALPVLVCFGLTDGYPEVSCCTDEGCRRNDPSPGPGYAMRTELGRPSSSMRLSTCTATFISVA
jgi:hypothetical protein